VFDDGELNRLYRYCRAVADTEADAYDLLQNGIERCLRAPPRDEGRRVAYAIRIIGNLWRDEWRRRQVVQFEPLADEPTPLDVDLAGLESIMIERDELDHVWQALTDPEREILFLWAVEGYTVTEVADHLGRPKGTVLSIVHRMRQRLRETGAKERAEG
jgi:RNA polymerase sigma-70 factor (ECF subfamily)